MTIRNNINVTKLHWNRIALILITPNNMKIRPWCFGEITLIVFRQQTVELKSGIHNSRRSEAAAYFGNIMFWNTIGIFK